MNPLVLINNCSGKHVSAPFLMFALSLFLLPSLLLSLEAETLAPDEVTSDTIDISLFADGIHHWDIFSPIRNYRRYETDEFEGIADQLLKFQNADGGWPKNIDWLGKLDPAFVRQEIPSHHWESSYDNRNTYPQIRYLAEAYEKTGNTSYRDAAVAGIGFVIKSQHASGGWRGADVDAITFNDDVMVGIMELLYDIELKKYPFGWIDDNLRELVVRAFDAALTVTLKCQVPIDGRLTGWCQQHAHETLLPVKARSYELPSVTPWESSEIVAFLMTLEHPSEDVKASIKAAIQWLESAAIQGYSYKEIPIEPRAFHQTTRDFDRVFIRDSSAPRVWARYYDLDKGKPFLCKRSGEIVYDYNTDISYERRVGYEWYGFWPEKVLAAFPLWYQKYGNH